MTTKVATVEQLIEYLKTIPKDTELSVLQNVQGSYHDYVEEVPLTLDFENYNYNVEFIDFTDNQSVKKGHRLYGRKFLTFGEL